MLPTQPPISRGNFRFVGSTIAATKDAEIIRKKHASKKLGECMKYVLILAVVLMASLTVGQEVEHAPTVAQCQADQRLWFSYLETKDSSQLPNIDVLSKWYKEMVECETVDPPNKFRYYNNEGEIESERFRRSMAFIYRHGLWEQFKAEDAAGKRP